MSAREACDEDDETDAAHAATIIVVVVVVLALDFIVDRRSSIVCALRTKFACVCYLKCEAERRRGCSDVEAEGLSSQNISVTCRENLAFVRIKFHWSRFAQCESHGFHVGINFFARDTPYLRQT